MRLSAVDTFRCPVCASGLRLDESIPDTPGGSHVAAGRLECGRGHRWPIEHGTPDFSYPQTLAESDDESRRKYDDAAEQYDVGLGWLFASFYEHEDRVRDGMIDLLESRPGDKALEVGCGTGKDSAHIVRRVAPGGEVYALELSAGMLQLAKRRLDKLAVAVDVEYVVGNASYLPFPDGMFDAVFHFGGLNTFADTSRALSEMARVARVGAKVVVGDEGVAPWLRQRLYGRILQKANPLYEHRPPLASLPTNARDVCLRWVLGNAFYVIDFRVAEGPPMVDLDLEIPGKRGGTLRSRFYGPGSPPPAGS